MESVISQLTILRCDYVVTMLQYRCKNVLKYVAATKICRLPEKLPQRLNV